MIVKVKAPHTTTAEVVAVSTISQICDHCSGSDRMTVTNVVTIGLGMTEEMSCWLNQAQAHHLAAPAITIGPLALETAIAEGEFSLLLVNAAHSAGNASLIKLINFNSTTEDQK